MDNPLNKDRLYSCNICNKNYSSYKSLWKHNNNIHKSENQPEISQISAENQPNISHPPTVSDISSNICVASSNMYNCSYCDNIYKHIQSRWKHEKVCKQIKNVKDQLAIEKAKLELMKEDNKKGEIEIKKMRIQLQLSKNSSNNITTNNTTTSNSHNQTNQTNQTNQIIQPNQTNQIIQPNQINQNNQNNNGTINNVFVKYNDISYDTLTKKDRDDIFNSYNMIEESIRKIHFNLTMPEQNNIYITNLKDLYCNVFDGKQFSAITKNELLPELIDIHLFELYLSKTKNKYKLKKSVIAKIDKLEEKLNKKNKKYIDENDKVYKNYKEYMADVIKLLIYNLSNKNQLDAIKKIDKFVHKKIEIESDGEEDISI